MVFGVPGAQGRHHAIASFRILECYIASHDSVQSEDTLGAVHPPLLQL